MNAVLELILKNDGRWYWHQLEHALADNEISKSGQLMDILNNLESQELIQS